MTTSLTKPAHGHARRGRRTPTFNSWRAMIERCIDRASTAYHKYGAKGVTVCERWLRFENFLADMGERPPNCTLDRRDNTKGYEIENCRWATQAEQQRNRTNNRRLTFRGKTQTMQEWSRETGLNMETIWYRLKRGWTVDRALSVPAVVGRNQSSTF